MSKLRGQKKPQFFKSSKRGIIYDKVKASDFLALTITYCCEQCSHYDEDSKQCTIGYESRLHRREMQLQMFELSGRMAFCRFSEID